MTRCDFHHETEATAVCEVCERPICGVCTTRVNAAGYCPGCRVGRANQLPWLACGFSLLAPGFGQVYNGEWSKAVLVFFTAPLVLPWIWGVVDAGRAAAAIRSGRIRAGTVSTGWLLVALKIVILPLALVYAVLAAAVVGGLLALING